MLGKLSLISLLLLALCKIQQVQPVAFKVVAGARANVCFANPAWCEECHGVWIFFVVVVFGLLSAVK